MNEKIKEMLHCIEMNCKHNKCFDGVKLDKEECELLLNLQQENERLREFLFTSLNNTNIAIEQIEIYKSRCEKAIELYKNCKEEDYCILSLNMYEVLIGSDEK